MTAPISVLTVQRDKQRVIVADGQPINDGCYITEADTFVACSDGTVFVIWGDDQIGVWVRGQSFASVVAFGKINGVVFESPIAWYSFGEEYQFVQTTRNLTPSSRAA